MNTSAISKNQVIIIQTIINKDNNLKAAKEDIIKEASNGRTASVKELLFFEAESLIKGLKKDAPLKKEVDKADPSFKMRGKILACAHEMGWHKKDAKGNIIRDKVTGKAKIDFQRVNNWCLLQFGKKKLDKYTYVELTKLVSIFVEKVYTNYLKGF